jgi:hypothetical protein
MADKAFQSSQLRPALCGFWVVCQALCIALLLAAPAGAQTRGTSPSLPTLPSGVPVNSRQDYDIPKTDPSEEQRRLRALNAQRQKRIVSDASKLLKLTTEFNLEITHATSDSLTQAQLRKVAVIEKLAHDLRENMSATVQPTTGIQSPFELGPPQ